MENLTLILTIILACSWAGFIGLALTSWRDLKTLKQVLTEATADQVITDLEKQRIGELLIPLALNALTMFQFTYNLASQIKLALSQSKSRRPLT